MNNLKNYIFTSLMALVMLSMSSACARQPDPYLKPNNTWISISGTVESVSPDSFWLDYGDGTVKVEMDDGDRDADAYKLIEGDKVTVNGMIDDDFYEMTKIEAGSVYVEKLGTYFYASATDEEDYTIWYTVPVVTGQVTIQGTVTNVDDDEFVVNTGLRSVTVGIDEMPFDPLDDVGYLKIDVGDMVRVAGVLQDGFFDTKDLKAQSIVKLMN